MKKIILLFILSITMNSYAQLAKSELVKPGIVSGKVIDQTTKESLPYVNIVVRDMAKKILTGGITDLEGKFRIKDIPEGTSILEVQFIGYKTFTRQISVSNKKRRLNLGTVALTEDNTTLDEVVVRAEVSTVVQKIDRKVINVGKDLTSAGATAAELLNNVQSVSVDSQTGDLSLRGNNNVRVLVDGKPSNMSTADLLQQIPSTSIKSVELITNPSAKYNPEGMSGIVNIILNKSANIGFNGSISSGITHGNKTRFNNSLNMNYKTGKVNFYTNYGYRTGKNHNYGVVNRTGTNASTQNFDFLNENNSHLLKLGADIYLDKKNTLSFYTTQNFRRGIGLADVKVSSGGNLLIHSPFKSDSDGSSTKTYNANYKLDFDKKGHNIEFEATFSDSKSPDFSTYEELISNTSFTNDVTNNRKSTLYNVDYTNPISKNGKLELGAEVRLNNTKNNFVTTQMGLTNSSFEYDRKIYSGYVNYGYKFEKVSMQIGARFEQYNVDATFADGAQNGTFEDDIFSVYPSAFFTFNPSEKNQYQVSYSRRVDRPSIRQVSPIREWATPLVTSIGNPDLRPQFTNSFEFNYTRKIKGGSLTFGTFYRKVNDEISTILFADPDDITGTKQIKSDANFDGNSRYGIELSSSYRLTKWWRTNTSVDFYSQKATGVLSNVQKEVTTNIFNARISNSFTATKNLRFQLFALYRGAAENIQFEVDPMWMVNLGASYKVLKGKGTINFRVNDIFQGMKFRFKTTDPFTQNGQFNWESKTAYVGFSYRFGGGKNKAKRRRNRDNNEKQGSGGFI